MLTEMRESKSLRVSSINDDGSEVLSSGATYSDTSISVIFDFVDKEYCKNHIADIQQSIKAFMDRLNGTLESDGLPQVKST